MNIELIGFHWPYPMFWILAGGIFYFACLFWHAHKLFSITTKKEAWKLVLLRGLAGLFFLMLILRPFVDRFELNPDAVRLVSLVDFSGSMDRADREGDESRINQVLPFFDLERSDSWINQAKARYGSVDRLGFAGDEVSAMRASSWDIPAQGKNTSLGDALSHILDSPEKQSFDAVVLFSDGRNNSGKSPLEAGELFRERGIPINVIGVGQSREFGNLSVIFSDIPSEVLAKEELILSAEIKNEFAGERTTFVRLFANDLELESRKLNLGPGETRTIRFSPTIPEVAGVLTYRVLVDHLEGDNDPGDNTDAQVVQIKPPAFFSALYLSSQVRPFYPFLKRALSGDRFQLSSLVRLGEQTFHARGENVSPEGYPQSPDFWMSFDVVILDSGSLRDLNATLVGSLKDFVQKRGGGLLLFGNPQPALELLGGLMPATETQSSLAKENLSLFVLPDPLFTERKRVGQWKPFLPAGMPAELITHSKPAAREVVGLKGAGGTGRSLLALQSYGAGKSAYWGSPHDWKRSLVGEEYSREFSLFWSGVIEWLGSGTVERIKVNDQENDGTAGEENWLVVDALGQDFDPSIDARIEANITGPEGFSKVLQLYPQGGYLGRYVGKFTPLDAGSYRVLYQLSYPDGEKLNQLSYLKIKQAGNEAKDTRYAGRELRMLANLTGGEFLEVGDVGDDWVPKLAQTLPTVRKRNNLADLWPLFLALFFVAGTEWLMRRKGGLL